MESCAEDVAASESRFTKPRITIDLEDGELIDSDDGELEYTPLARPENFKPYLNPSSIMNMNIQDDHTDDSEHEPSSEADSDSDTCNAKPKKRKIKFKRFKRSEASEQNKKNKYSIWCKTVQEDTLADDLLVCDVTKNNYLGIETYNYRLNRNLGNDTLAFTDRKEANEDDGDDNGSGIERRFSNKRRYRDRKNVKLRLGRRSSFDSDNERRDARHIPDLVVNIDSPDEDVAKDICIKLSEEKDNLILRIVENAGKQKAIELFKETKRIEEDGGMIIKNGTRRRTPGGVFIFLVKRDKDISQELMDKIFIEDKLEAKEKKSRFKQRHQKVEQLKQTLTDSSMLALRTRAELWVSGQVTAEDMNHVSNPPPSPATDGRDGSSDVDSNIYMPNSPRLMPNVDNSIVSRDASILNKLTEAKIHESSDPRASLNLTYDDDYIDAVDNDEMDLF